MLERIVQHDDLRRWVERKQTPDAIDPTFAHSHRHVREDQLALQWFVTDHIGTLFSIHQKKSAAVATVAPAQHGHTESLLKQHLTDMQNQWRLPGATDLKITNGYHRDIELLGSKDAEVEQQIAKPDRKAIRQRQWPEKMSQQMHRPKVGR